jgi:hypothetical protein
MGAGANDAYRFPGPYLFGSDTRSLTTELVSVSREFGEKFGPARVVSDRYTSLGLAAYGDAFTASGSQAFPTYDLFLRPGDPDPYLVHELSSSGYTYLVVDERLSKYTPIVGIYFAPGEPLDPSRQLGSSIPQAALDYFEKARWASKVMSSSNYSIYRLNFEAVGTKECFSPGCGAGTN